MGTIPRRVILWTGALIIVAGCGLLLAAYVFRPALENVVRSRAVELLRGEFGSDARFQSFDVRLFPRVHVSAGGVMIGHDNAQPLIQVATVESQSSWVPWHIRTLVLTGLSVHIPTGKSAAVSSRTNYLDMSVDNMFAEHAQVEILPSDSGQTPLHFGLANLHVRNFNATHPADFSATVVSPEPRAYVQASGKLGPWNAQNPSLTPLDGTYTMPQLNLTALPGLHGDVSSNGRFQGVLRRIEIAGDASASDFSLSLSGHKEVVRANFQAVVDASDSSASIDKMSGMLRSSSFSGNGVVRNLQDDHTRDIALNIAVNQGRLEDIVPLGVKSKTSPIRGAVQLHAKLEILPGQQDILDRLRLDADFDAPDARFSSFDLRQRLREASRKAQGHPKDGASGSSIASIQGHVIVDHGIAKFSDLEFGLEGASARLEGSYQLASERLDLHGEVWMDAKLSQTATGMKAFLLKAAQPFFRGKQAGSRVPIKVTGTRSDPQFSVDLEAKAAGGSSHPRGMLFSH